MISVQHPAPVATTMGDLTWLDDTALLQRIAQGDRGAFATMHRRYYPRLLRFCVRVTGQVDLAEEAVTDTMVIVWRKAEDFSNRSQVSTWLFGIAYRVALKALRRLQRQPVWCPVEDQTLFDPNRPDETAEQVELQRDIERAIAALPPKQRAVVELTHFHGYGYTEIATILDCPVNTVKTRMFHARARLRVLLDETLFDGSRP